MELSEKKGFKTKNSDKTKVRSLNCELVINLLFTRKQVSPPKQNLRSQKKEENLKTRSGRRVKVPQLDGNADSSDESSSRSGMEVDLPQTDGANDAPRAQQVPQMYQQMAPTQQQQHNGNTHTRPTVIPILMPPGNW